jgi:hypothetical protein
MADEKVLSFAEAAALNEDGAPEALDTEEAAGQPAEESVEQPTGDEAPAPSTKPAAPTGDDAPITMTRAELVELIRSIREENAGQDDDDDEAPAAASQPAPLSPEQEEEAKNTFLNALYERPFDTITQAVNAVVEPLLQPLRQFVQANTTQAQLDKTMQQVQAAHPDFAEHATALEAVLKEMPWMAQQGKQGIEAALIIARSRKATSTTQAASRRAAGLGAAARPAPAPAVNLETAFKAAILKYANTGPKF